MHTLNDQDFAHLKKLCRLESTPDEDKEIRESLQNVLNYINQLNEVSTDGVPACNYVLQTMLKNQMRNDEVKNLLSRDKFLANAPDQIGGMVRVPPVLKG